jgi:hypothetical protein
MNDTQRQIHHPPSRWRVEERTPEDADDLIATIRQYFDLDFGIIAGVEGAKAIVERCFPAGQNRVL